MTTAMTLFGNKTLRMAVQQNRVNFPAQIPSFAPPGVSELQRRIVHLYFISGWTIERIGNRYAISDAMVRKMLTAWRIRAIASGYVQEIDPEPATPSKESDLIARRAFPHSRPQTAGAGAGAVGMAGDLRQIA